MELKHIASRQLVAVSSRLSLGTDQSQAAFITQLSTPGKHKRKASIQSPRGNAKNKDLQSVDTGADSVAIGIGSRKYSHTPARLPNMDFISRQETNVQKAKETNVEHLQTPSPAKRDLMEYARRAGATSAMAKY